ncbi:MAG TPA: type II secretion system protein [Candidatus Paceibacterota bacterium]|nr:type II secretion system protein [Candidatus Paceibacterota bacterium]HMP18963.1 type II secretion system protein [Candidatus Paceibacterota bacterium]HMP85476.1 type II secretion system protein [Candidatus Paceibacterota bacterium]
MKYKKHNLGFTLIELLVVIAIISLLSTVALASVDSSRKKARDSVRMLDVRTLETAILTYANDNGSIPEAVAENYYGWEISSVMSTPNFINTLVQGGYLPSPGLYDPINNAVYHYAYIKRGDQGGCSFGTTGVLFVRFEQSDVNFGKTVPNDWGPGARVLCIR